MKVRHFSAFATGKGADISTLGIIALGANLPLGASAPELTLGHACDALSAAPLQIIARSRFFATPAFPDPTQPEFVNSCVTIETDLTPKSLLAVLHEVERDLGRSRTQRWGTRTVDLDLLALGSWVLPTLARYREWAELGPEDQAVRAPEELILPHPRIAERPFVLVPLQDVAPLWRHPVTGKTAEDMLAALPDADIKAIRPLA